MPNRLFYLNSLDRPISYIRGDCLVLLPCFKETFELNLNANSVGTDQMRSVASDLGLHCSSVSLLWDARLKWVEVQLFLKFPDCVVDTRHQIHTVNSDVLFFGRFIL